jgi:hypothetical protein
MQGSILKITLILLAHPDIKTKSIANQKILSRVNTLKGVEVHNLIERYPRL